MSTILSTVTDAESKVIETVRSLQDPVVGYVRRGVELADSRLPEISYPGSLPKPGEILDSQFDFLKSLLDAQHDFVKAIVDTVAPLAGAETPRRSASSSKSTTKSAKSAKSA
jgi:hypothetical protein